MEQVYSKLGWTNKNKQLPVMFMSGGDDPAVKVIKTLKKLLPTLNTVVFQILFQSYIRECDMNSLMN